LLDCGCGAGRFARMAADRGASVAGIDASAELIEIAAARGVSEPAITSVFRSLFPRRLGGTSASASDSRDDA
jgi:predicted TPR repeat methyltransferase